LRTGLADPTFFFAGGWIAGSSPANSLLNVLL
jgi:hypothetical protein